MSCCKRINNPTLEHVCVHVQKPYHEPETVSCSAVTYDTALARKIHFIAGIKVPVSVAIFTADKFVICNKFDGPLDSPGGVDISRLPSASCVDARFMSASIAIAVAKSKTG